MVPSTNPAITAAPATGDPLETATSSMPIVTPHGTRMVAAPISGGASRLPAAGAQASRRLSRRIAKTMTVIPAATSSRARASGGSRTAEPTSPSSTPASA